MNNLKVYGSPLIKVGTIYLRSRQFRVVSDGTRLS